MLLWYVRLGVLLLALQCGLPGNAVAQAPPTPTQAPSPPTPAPAPSPPTAPPGLPSTLTVLVVDVQALLQNSKAAKMVRGQIEQTRNEKRKKTPPQGKAVR